MERIKIRIKIFICLIGLQVTGKLELAVLKGPERGVVTLGPMLLFRLEIVPIYSVQKCSSWLGMSWNLAVVFSVWLH